jgi:hypothetical protein
VQFRFVSVSILCSGYVLVCDYLTMLKKIFKDVLEDRLQVASLLDPENFGKLDVALDEAFPEVRCS